MYKILHNIFKSSLISFKCFESMHNYCVTFFKHLRYVIIIKLSGVCIYYLQCLSRICTIFPHSSFTTLAETLVWLEGQEQNVQYVHCIAAIAVLSTAKLRQSCKQTNILINSQLLIVIYIVYALRNQKTISRFLTKYFFSRHNLKTRDICSFINKIYSNNGWLLITSEIF